jgi:hypothetical protein
MATVTVEGGEKLQRYFDQLAKKVGRGGAVKAGFLASAKYPDGTQVALVAAVQEYGSPANGIPPRPFMRTTVREKSPQWAKTAAEMMVATDYDVEKTLNLLGTEMADDIREAIVDLTAPALSEVTLLLRAMKAKNPSLKVGRRVVWEAIRRVKAGERSGLSGAAAKPLVETGHLLASVSSEVEME